MNRNESEVARAYVRFTALYVPTIAITVRRVDKALFVHHCDRKRWTGKASATRPGPPDVAVAILDERRVLHPTPAQRGFSLLELLVVLFIAGLLTSLSVAWLDSGQGAALQALERLAAASRAQAAEALHAGQIHGLRWNGQRPEFVRQVRENDQLRWQVEPVALGEWPLTLKPDWPAAGEPRLVFTPNGVGRPQVLRWHWTEGGEQWQWDSAGRLQRTSLP